MKHFHISTHVFSLPSGLETIGSKVERGNMDEGTEIMRSQCRELVTKEGDCEPH